MGGVDTPGKRPDQRTECARRFALRRRVPREISQPATLTRVGATGESGRAAGLQSPGKHTHLLRPTVPKRQPMLRRTTMASGMGRQRHGAQGDASTPHTPDARGSARADLFPVHILCLCVCLHIWFSRQGMGWVWRSDAVEWGRPSGAPLPRYHPSVATRRARQHQPPPPREAPPETPLLRATAHALTAKRTPRSNSPCARARAPMGARADPGGGARRAAAQPEKVSTTAGVSV